MALVGVSEKGNTKRSAPAAVAAVLTGPKALKKKIAELSEALVASNEMIKQQADAIDARNTGMTEQAAIIEELTAQVDTSDDVEAVTDLQETIQSHIDFEDQFSEIVNKDGDGIKEVVDILELDLPGNAPQRDQLAAIYASMRESMLAPEVEEEGGDDK